MHSTAVKLSLKRTKLSQILVAILKNSCNLHIWLLKFSFHFFSPDWVSQSACYFSKAENYSLSCTSKVWGLDRLSCCHFLPQYEVFADAVQSGLLWKLHYTAKYKLIFNFFVLSPPFLLLPLEVFKIRLIPALSNPVWPQSWPCSGRRLEPSTGPF